MTDWNAWHGDYEDPSSRLSRRLAVVQALLRDALHAAPAGPIRVVSACAGDGRDLAGALAGHPRAADVTALLVELDPVLSARAQETGFEVRQADAGSVATFDGWTADVLMLCGIFGNVSDEDVRRTVDAASSLCSPGATALWTRGRFDPDLTPALRQWWLDAGWDERAFVSSGFPDGYSVGMAVLQTAPAPRDESARLFTFVR